MVRMDTPRRVIELENVHVTFAGAPPVLDGVHWHLNAGEKVGLMGANGNGKSTLLHLILGLVSPTQGTLRLFGQPMRQESDFSSARRQIGLLFQHSDDQLFCPTVLEDVAFGPRNLGFSAEEAVAIAHQTLAQLHIDDLADRVPHHLSGGQKKLVALATILSMKPEVLLLDEPIAGLDTDTAERLTAFFQAMPQTCLIVSHHTAFLEQVTHRIDHLVAGQIE